MVRSGSGGGCMVRSGSGGGERTSGSVRGCLSETSHIWCKISLQTKMGVKVDNTDRGSLFLHFYSAVQIRTFV